MDKAAQATLVGDVFDDAATGQGLLNFFVRGLSSGALTLDEARQTGLTVEELQGRSFLRILESRREGRARRSGGEENTKVPEYTEQQVTSPDLLNSCNQAMATHAE